MARVKRFNKIVLLSILMSICFIGFVFGVLGSTPVKANTDGIALEMVEGAEIRVDEIKGIRFKVKISSDDYTELTTDEIEASKKQLGVLIVPYDNLLAAQNASMTEYHKFNQKLDAVIYEKSYGENATVNKLYQDGSFYLGNAVLKDVLFENMNMRFVGIGYYAEYDSIGNPSYTYTLNLKQNENARSIFEVATSAYTAYKDNPTVKAGIEEIMKHSFNNAGGVDKATPVDLSTAQLVLNKESGKIDYFVDNAEADLTASLKIGEVSIPVNATFTSNNENAIVTKYGQVNFIEEDFATITASVFDKSVSVDLKAYNEESGVVQYFNKAFGKENVSYRFGESESKWTMSKEQIIPGDDYSLKYCGDGGYTGDMRISAFILDNPYIKNISSYKYFYFYVYASLAGTKLNDINGVGVNENATITAELKQNAWTLIVLEKNNIGFCGTKGPTVANMDNTFSQDISSLGIGITWPKNQGNQTLFISKIMVANELPTVEMPSYALTGEEFTIPTATYGDNTGLTQKVYFDGELYENATKIFDTEGDKEIKIQVYKNDKFVFEITKTLSVFAKEDNAVTYFHKPFGDVGVSTNFSNSSIKIANDAGRTWGNEEYSLKMTPSSSTVGGIVLNKPFITDLTPYQYLYFYVYAEVASATLYVGAHSTSNKVSLIQGWNRICLTRHSENSSIFLVENTLIIVTNNGSLTGKTITFSSSGNLYVSSIRVSNTAP